MAATPEQPELDVPAPDFALPATDGKTYTRADIMGANGAVIVFICNHCPYVKAIVGRLVDAVETLAREGIGFAAVCANDAHSHPADSFENMEVFARENGFFFPYLHDESQDTARAFGAVCTPDFFGLDRSGTIKYRGRLDAGRKDPPPEGAKAELIEAMREIAATGAVPADQMPAMGCSIKWKAA